MALRTPPSWLQNGSHPAENDRLTIQGLLRTTGILSSGDLAVAQSGTPAMSVSVAAGWASILGTFQSNMGAYQVINDAATTLTVTTADPTNPRIDLVVIAVQDAFYSGISNTVVFTVVAGTPAGSPVAPAAPVNSIVLAQIAVGAAVTSILNANITDKRVLIASPFSPTPSTFGLFAKTDGSSTAFKTSGLSTAQIKAGTYVDVNGTLITFAVDTAITMPALAAGTNYFIYVSTAGVIQAVAASGTWPTPVAAPPANSRLIGGFHYAMGSNAPAQAGGDTTAQINAYSFWDLKWKPSALDPRGMTLVNNQFWADIYLLNTNPQVNGTSSYNQQIADGASLAVIPTAFGGNGATTYAAQDWWSTAECLQAFQKRLPKYAEFQALAYGTTENTSQGTDPVNTIGSGGRNAYTSKWGIILATGNMDVWGADFGGPYAAAGWVNNNGGRGQTYDLPNAVLFGGVWGGGVNAGSRVSSWGLSPSTSTNDFGGRGVCDHLTLV